MTARGSLLAPVMAYVSDWRGLGRLEACGAALNGKPLQSFKIVTALIIYVCVIL